MYRAVVIRKYKAILDLSSGENEFPVAPVKYHISCRKDFVNQKSLQAISKKFSSDGTAKGQPEPRRSAHDPAQTSISAVHPVFFFFFATRQNINLVREQGKPLKAQRNLEETLR